MKHLKRVTVAKAQTDEEEEASLAFQVLFWLRVVIAGAAVIK